jgi:ParB-like chromosome segregation protein Spo0J
VKITAPLREVPLARVDLDKLPLALSPPTDLTLLMDSIQAVGLLAPPWLRRRGGRWEVVAGVKRLKALALLGWERVPARTLPARTPDSHCLLVYLYDNAFTRGFNLAEQAALASHLLDGWDRQTVVARFLPALGQPPSPRVLSRLVALANLEAPFLALAAQGRLALTAAAFLADWDPKDRAAVLPFLESLPLSQSLQEEFLEGLDLLARREGTVPGEILNLQELRQSLEDRSLTPPERVRAVRQALARRVSPRLTAAREAFAAALGKLGIREHPRLRLAPPAAFEGPDSRLEIKFRDATELQRLLEEMVRLTQNKDFLDLDSS